MLPEGPTMDRARRVGVISLAFLAFQAVSGGPFGIEGAVKSGGVLGAIIGILVVPIVWGLPQAFMTAELSSMIEENGGNFMWVHRGMGPTAGYFNAANLLVSNLLDIATYPVLFASYVVAYCEEVDVTLSDLQVYLLKFTCLTVVVMANLVGIRCVVVASIAMTLFVLAPFMIQPFMLWNLSQSEAAVDAGQAQNATSTANVLTITTAGLLSIAKPFEVGTYTSNLLWNFQGWDLLGCLAGEVSNTGRTYPLAVLLALVMITVNYLVPVICTAMVIPDYELWTEGTLETAALRMSRWLGLWVELAAAVTAVGILTTNLAMHSRAIWAISHYGMLPPIFAMEFKRFGTPAAAIIAQAVATLFLMPFDFESLVSIDIFFTCICLIFEMISFLRLRYIEPNTERPYKIPGGMPMAWTLTVLKLGFLFIVMIFSTFMSWAVAIVFNVLLGIYFWSKKKMDHVKEEAALELTKYETIPLSYGTLENEYCYVLAS